ncbi:F-box protein At3g07870-like [Cucurbita maxima]|uniref:F-box protein At3g07870-like n=1 Tax=Cucurbita maxima TaxID=3661 RepID=A0A6J1HYC7_CUCMA|nr:F-box protein At3g07870-like [Cucurbita maxima]
MANDQDIISNKIPELIHDVVELILSKLPYYYLPSCRLVCKTWNNVILSSKYDLSISADSNFLLAHVYSNRRDCPSFRDLHCLELDPDHVKGVRSVASLNLHRKYFQHSFISTINSCNGLLAFVVTKNTKRWLTPNTVVIFNPMTNEYLELPKDEFKRKRLNCSYGFGFCPRTKQYKVVRNSTVDDRNSTVHSNYKSEIFAFGTRQEWTRIESPSCSFHGCHGAYLNGGLHWIGQNDLGYNVIYRLNMEDEKYKQIPFPNHDGYFPYIGVFNGALHLTISMEEYEYRIWKMEGDGSWIKSFSVIVPTKNIISFSKSTVEQIKTCKDGKILCVWAGAQFVLYDPKTETMEKLMEDTIVRYFSVHNIDCFNFSALRDILTGKFCKF